MDLGKIEFTRGGNDELLVGQHFNPSLLPRSDRVAIAESLREIAGQIETGYFDIGGDAGYRFRPAPADPRESR